MRALLDVNVLIALFDPDHIHHISAAGWFEKQGPAGWATCPITQNGLLRIMSQPRYPNPFSIPELISRLKTAVESKYHHLLPDDISLLDRGRVEQTMLLSSSQLTDVYLLALAVKHDCLFATFDNSIPAAAVLDKVGERLVVL